MKLDLTKILLVAALIFIGWQNFFQRKSNTSPAPATITIPPSTGGSGVVALEPEVVIDTFYVKGDVVEVDKGYKELYEKAKDSLEKQNLFMEAIKINKYSDTIVNNNEVVITGKATTRGSLLNYSVDYTIKEKKLTYIPEVVSKLPSLSVGIGLDVGVPLLPENNFVVKANLSIMNNKGKVINVGYDTNKTVWVGYTKVFKIKK